MAQLRIAIAAAALALTVATIGASYAGEATLGGAAVANGRYFGAALDPDALDERQYRELAATQLTSVTPENAMKWGLVEPLRGEYDWERAPTSLSPSPRLTDKNFAATRSSGTGNCRCG